MLSSNVLAMPTAVVAAKVSRANVKNLPLNNINSFC